MHPHHSKLGLETGEFSEPTCNDVSSIEEIFVRSPHNWYVPRLCAVWQWRILDNKQHIDICNFSSGFRHTDFAMQVEMVKRAVLHLTPICTCLTPICTCLTPTWPLHEDIAYRTMPDHRRRWGATRSEPYEYITHDSQRLTLHPSIFDRWTGTVP